jgi:hypothetical protein
MAESVVGDGCQQLLNFCFRICVDGFMRLTHPVYQLSDVASDDALSVGVGQHLLDAGDDLVDGICRPRPTLVTFRCFGSSCDEIGDKGVDVSLVEPLHRKLPKPFS